METVQSPTTALTKTATETALAESARPRILGVRFGVNPNSSSLGVDVSFLLFGGTAAVAVALMLSAWLRGWRRKVEVVGSGAVAAAVED